MLRDLRQICERPGASEPDDFRTAARAILERQFLLLERARDRDPYRLIANHFDYYVNLFDALGWTLHRDDTFGLIGLLPSETESFARLRLVDSLLLLCQSLAHARAVIQAWRQDYNEQAPHSMLDYQTPAEVAEQLRQR